MHPQLLEIKKGLDSNSDRVSHMAETATEEEWATRPSAESWSASECVQHLNATSRAMVPRMIEQLLTSQRAEKTPRYRFDFTGWLIWRASSPRNRMKVKTKAPFVPRNSKPKRLDLIAWAVCQSDVLDLLEKADGHPLNGMKIVSPFEARARYNIYAGFRILEAHQRRHLKQAERALAALRENRQAVSPGA